MDEVTKKPRILVVDDEPHIVTMLKSRLTANGYEVITAVDGQEALEKARNEIPELVILDLMLPRLDGFKVCRMLKFDEKYRHIPVIMFSARAQKSDQEMGMETGADAYVVKPFRPEELLGKIRELLGEKKG
jgi:two-component system alkaline phosphatase synthesis response regulator PhoP